MRNNICFGHFFWKIDDWKVVRRKTSLDRLWHPLEWGQLVSLRCENYPPKILGCYVLVSLRKNFFKIAGKELTSKSRKNSLIFDIDQRLDIGWIKLSIEISIFTFRRLKKLYFILLSYKEKKVEYFIY